MTLRTQHTILKHFLDLNLKVEREDAVLAEVETIVKEKVELPMEVIFKEFCSEDVVMQFDKIYLDLGVINPDHLKEELLAAYSRTLRHFFEHQVGFEKNFLVDNGSVCIESLRETRQLTVAKKIQEDILHFLRYGYWPVLSSCPKENYDQVILEQLEQETSFADRMLEIISKNTGAATRFALQSTSIVQNIVQNRWKEQMTVFEKDNFHLLNFLLLRSSINVDMIGKTLRVQLMAIPVILQQPSETVKWIQGLGISSQFRQELQALFSSGYFNDNSITGELVAFWKETLSLLSPGQQPDNASGHDQIINKDGDKFIDNDKQEKEERKIPETGVQQESPNGNQLKEQQFSDKAVDNNHLQTSLPGKKILSTDKLLPGFISIPGKHRSFLQEGIPDKTFFISNAGLVLLHPFLPAFFKATGLLENDVFRDTESAQHAIHLLEYLATGSEQPLEAGLIFNKILCGWPMEMPLARYIELSAMEKKEAHSLLQAVIEHWGALKSSSPEALQQAFLRRIGKLTDDAGIWQLKVESSGLDILLGQLPWSISVIKLPWMNGHIIVDWY